ncbi:hypothetical protein [Mucilaginibacter sp.]|uniref:hypothetical protein n=1 Tax=Mucilaginibacter sp. TaxID=1882438 RepID=UPI0035BC46BA
MIIEIKIAVQPVVKAFLSYGHSVDPFEVYRNSQYGIFLFNALSNLRPVETTPADPKKLKLYQEEEEKYKEKYSETLKLQMTDRVWIRQGLYISKQKQIDFNNMVLYNLDEHFCNFMNACSGLGVGKQQDHFFRFRERYRLNENVFTLKCMEKKWQRHRSRVTA